MIELAMNISTISLTNTNIDYLEAEVNAEEPLHAFFKNLDIKISNFTADSNKLSLNDMLKLKLKGTFMNEGELDINLSLEVLDSNDNFKIDGSIQNMKLNELNPILKNSAFIMFTDGHLSFLDFDMQGNNENIKGKLDLDYRGLYNLQILRKKSEMEERKERGRKRKSEKALLSFLASNIAPVDYNASYKHYHSGEINFDRNTNKSIINFIINGLKSGVLDSFLHNHESLLKKMKEKGKAKKIEAN